MRIVGLCVLILGTAAVAAAPVVDISITLREESDLEGVANIGANGGASGTYERIDYGYQLVLDGTWQQFTFDVANANANGVVSSFSNGNNVLEGSWGTIDAIWLIGSFEGQLDYWVDTVVDTVDANGPAPGGISDIMLGESFQNQPDGTEVLFRSPTYSGSTQGVTGNSFAGVDNTQGYDDMSSYHAGADVANPFSIRMTAHQTPIYGNPVVALENDSVISFWMKGIPEPATLALLAIGGLVALRRH